MIIQLFLHSVHCSTYNSIVILYLEEDAVSITGDTSGLIFLFYLFLATIKLLKVNTEPGK